MWDKNLTDADGPYVELMTGVYTDNQPDFTCTLRHREKSAGKIEWNFTGRRGAAFKAYGSGG